MITLIPRSPHCPGCSCGPQPAKVEIRSDGSEFGDRLLEIFRKALRDRRGDGPETLGVA